MTLTQTVRDVFRAAWRDYRHAWPALFLFEALFKAAQAVVFVPAAAAVLAAILAATGRVAVTNFDLLDFLLTPGGVIYAAVAVTFGVASLLVEQAAIMAIAAAAGTGTRMPLKQALRLIVGSVARVARLGAAKAGLLAAAFAPFVLAGWLTYLAFLTGHDVYFYLNARPPVFWVAAAVGGVVVVAAVAFGTALYVRWSFALPILVFENTSPAAALRASRDRVRGAVWRVGLILVGWQAIVLGVGTGVLAAYRLFAAAVLAKAGETPVLLTVGLLVGQGGLVATWSFAVVIGQGLLTRRLYLARGGQREPAEPPPPGVDSTGREPPPAWVRRIAYVPLALALVGPVTLWFELQRYRVERPPVAVTAHRGHARAAPENTLAAVRKAVESGADYAEVDVQLTADGVPVLLHDRDLMRVAGDPRRLTDLTLAEVRALDVGRWFGPEFAGERVPTLAEVIDACRGRMKLNVELKLFGPDRGLTAAVARAVRDAGFEADCLVTSFDVQPLSEVRRLAPGVRTGLIVAHAVGDVSRVDVEVLNVRADHLSDALLRDARGRGREVHVWTVNEPADMLRQMKRGVDNILTSDPDALIQVRGDWLMVSGTERLALAASLLLGLGP